MDLCFSVDILGKQLKVNTCRAVMYWSTLRLPIDSAWSRYHARPRMIPVPVLGNIPASLCRISFPVFIGFRRTLAGKLVATMAS